MLTCKNRDRWDRKHDWSYKCLSALRLKCISMLVSTKHVGKLINTAWAASVEYTHILMENLK